MFFPFSLLASSPFCGDPSILFGWSAAPGLSLALLVVYPCLFGVLFGLGRLLRLAARLRGIVGGLTGGSSPLRLLRFGALALI